VIMTHLVTKQTSVDLEQIKDVTDMADTVSEQIELAIYLHKFVPDLATRIGYGKKIPEEIADDLNAIGILLGKKKRTEALSELNRLEKAWKEKDTLRGYIQLLRASTMSEMGRKKAAYSVYKEAFSLYEPTTADVYLDYIGLLANKDKYEDAANIATRFLEKRPEDVAKLSLDWFGQFTAQLFIRDKIETRNNLLLAAAAALHSQKGKKGIDPRDWIFAEAIPLLVKQGKTEQAAAYLDYLHNPGQMQFLLMDRRMSALWPQLEVKAGKDLSKAIDAYVEHTRKKAEAEDNDYEDKTRYISALNKAGHFKKARTYAEPILKDWSEIEAVGEDAYWFVNAHAYTLFNLNRVDEASGVLDKLLVLGVEENSNLISMAINQAGILLKGGQFQKALDKVETIESYGEDMTSDTGKIFYLDVKACALYQLGRKEDANKIFDEVLKPLVKNQIALEMKTLVCLNRLDAAEKILIKRLETEKHQDGTFQVFTRSLHSKNEPAYLAIFMDKLDELKSRPSVQEVARTRLRPLTVNGQRVVWGEY